LTLSGWRSVSLPIGMKPNSERDLKTQTLVTPMPVLACQP
jgi:hypothetical protein